MIPIGILGSGSGSGWIASLTGASWEQGNAITVDSSGNSYVVGQSQESDFGIQLAKYDSNGTIQWQRRLNGSVDDYGRGVGVDSSGNVYLAGSVGVQGHLAKYDSSGTIQWQKRIGGSASVSIEALAVDGDGNLYIAGSVIPSSQNGFIAKYNSSGTLQWQKRLGAANTVYFQAISLDSSGNVYTAGTTSVDGTEDIVIAKYNSSGALQWQRLFGGGTSNESSQGTGISIDSSGNVYLAGTTNLYGEFNGLVIKYNSSGTLQWARRFGFTATLSLVLKGVATDSTGDVYLVGQTNSPGSSAFQIAKYNTSGALQWQRTLDSSSETEVGFGITASSQHIYITGYSTAPTASIDFLTAKLPSDGSGLGTYRLNGKFFTYAASSATDGGTLLNSSVPTLADNTASTTDSSTSLTDSVSTLTANVVTI